MVSGKELAESLLQKTQSFLEKLESYKKAFDTTLRVISVFLKDSGARQFCLRCNMKYAFLPSSFLLEKCRACGKSDLLVCRFPNFEEIQKPVKPEQFTAEYWKCFLYLASHMDSLINLRRALQDFEEYLHRWTNEIEREGKYFPIDTRHPLLERELQTASGLLPYVRDSISNIKQFSVDEGVNAFHRQLFAEFAKSSEELVSSTNNLLQIFEKIGREEEHERAS